MLVLKMASYDYISLIKTSGVLVSILKHCSYIQMWYIYLLYAQTCFAEAVSLNQASLNVAAPKESEVIAPATRGSTSTRSAGRRGTGCGGHAGETCGVFLKSFIIHLGFIAVLVWKHTSEYFLFLKATG